MEGVTFKNVENLVITFTTADGRVGRMDKKTWDYYCSDNEMARRLRNDMEALGAYARAFEPYSLKAFTDVEIVQIRRAYIDSKRAHEN